MVWGACFLCVLNVVVKLKVLFIWIFVLHSVSPRKWVFSSLTKNTQESSNEELIAKSELNVSVGMNVYTYVYECVKWRVYECVYLQNIES